MTGAELLNEREGHLADVFEVELEWLDGQDWSGLSPREYRAIVARHLAMHVLAALAPEPAEPSKPIERPGVTINKSLAELLGLDGTTKAEADWERQMKAIAEAEFRAWANRDLTRLGNMEGFIAGFVAAVEPVPAPEPAETFEDALREIEAAAGALFTSDLWRKLPDRAKTNYRLRAVDLLASPAVEPVPADEPPTDEQFAADNADWHGTESDEPSGDPIQPMRFATPEAIEQ